MKNRERVVIYCLLALLGTMNLVFLLGESGTHAYAAQPDSAPGLGPASTLTLTSADDKPLVLHNAKQRLAWGESPHERSYSVAYVHIGSILTKLMDSDAVTEERERLVNELAEQEAAYRDQLDELGRRLQEMDPESAEAREAYEKGESIYTEYMEWQQAAMARRGKLDAEHLERAYRELTAAVEVVADRRNIDTVYRFIPTEEAFEAENPEQAMMAIRLRTALRYPPELDITYLILDELSLELE